MLFWYRNKINPLQIAGISVEVVCLMQSVVIHRRMLYCIQQGFCPYSSWSRWPDAQQE